MTPKSHFARKVRLLLDHLELSYDMVDVGNVAEDNPDNFYGNPLMGVPVFEDGSERPGSYERSYEQRGEAAPL